MEKVDGLNLAKYTEKKTKRDRHCQGIDMQAHMTILKTLEILEMYDPPTGRTDAIAMQHDVDYSVCGDNRKCKHKADRKIVKSLDAIPYKDRQWGRWLATSIISTKQKIGLGLN